MKKRTWTVACLCAAAMVCSGCGQVTALTEQEEEIIAEYAAKTLLRYDKGYNSKYETDVMQEAKAEAKARGENAQEEVVTAEPEPTPEVTPTPKAEPTPEPTMTPVPETTPTPVPEPEITQTPVQTPTENRLSPTDVGKLFGMEGVDVNYVGFEASDKYPVVPDSELAFVMNATQGAKLVVVKFDLVNRTDSAKTCNIAGQNIKFQMRFNQADYVGVQKTLLPDDFALVNCVLQPGETKRVVVISQVAAGYETTISNVDLIARVGGENTIISLQ